MDKVTIKLIKTVIVYTILILCVIFMYSLLVYDSDEYDLGAGFKYYSDNEMILGFVDIPPYVEAIGYDDNFIVVKQNPRGLNPDIIFDKMEYCYPNGLDSTYYWIIDKRHDLVYGPFLFNVFEKECKQHGVYIALKKMPME